MVVVKTPEGIGSGSRLLVCELEHPPVVIGIVNLRCY